MITLTKNDNLTYLMRNFISYTPEMQMPVSPFPLPETGAVSTDLIKLEGNLHKINLAWRIVPRAENVIYRGAFSDTSASIVEDTSGTASGYDDDVDTDDQINFWEDDFEFNSLLDVYKLRKWKKSGASYTHTKTYTGVIARFHAVQTESEPVSLNATVEFFRGKVITGVQDS